MALGAEFVVGEVDVLEPGRLAWRVRDGLQDIEVVDGPREEDVGAEIQIAVFVELAIPGDGTLSISGQFIQAFCNGRRWRLS